MLKNMFFLKTKSNIWEGGYRLRVLDLEQGKRRPLQRETDTTIHGLCKLFLQVYI